MTSFETAVFSGIKEPVALLDRAIPILHYTPIDLSVNNVELRDLDISDPEVCQGYIDSILSRHNATVAYGGYMEKRNLYKGYSGFTEAGQPLRNIHLGLDLWSRAGTKVCAPLDGLVHSFMNNFMPGDYGPTIILTHELDGVRFHSLYGHLSLESLKNLGVGQLVPKGHYFATLGTPDINVNYAPHLHFQLIRDLANHSGDFPGVCSAGDVAYYSKICPDPNLLLKL